jgi:hypothetical protein
MAEVDKRDELATVVSAFTAEPVKILISWTKLEPKP